MSRAASALESAHPTTTARSEQDGGLRPRRAVMTLAVGKPVYVNMAVSLARSVLLWHPAGDLPLYLITDRADLLPADLCGRIDVIPVEPGQYGEGFTPKLHLDQLAPAHATLFIDADCLCVGRLDSVFERFAGRSVAVIGGRAAEGEWFGDVASVCRQFGLAALPKFNGGVYYLEDGAAAASVYRTARELEGRYDEIGLVRLRGRPNDELLMAIAMALAGLTAIEDDGSILADPQAFPGPLAVDVFGGTARLTNPPLPHHLHVPWNQLAEATPLLVHFLGHHVERHPYLREELRLSLRFAHRWPATVATLAAILCRSLPMEARRLTKTVLRPLYRQLLGTRTPSTSARL